MGGPTGLPNRARLPHRQAPKESFRMQETPPSAIERRSPIENLTGPPPPPDGSKPHFRPIKSRYLTALRLQTPEGVPLAPIPALVGRGSRPALRTESNKNSRRPCLPSDRIPPQSDLRNKTTPKSHTIFGVILCYLALFGDQFIFFQPSEPFRTNPNPTEPIRSKKISAPDPQLHPFALFCAFLRQKIWQPQMAHPVGTSRSVNSQLLNGY
jgi:hypothetical protein